MNTVFKAMQNFYSVGSWWARRDSNPGPRDYEIAKRKRSGTSKKFRIAAFLLSETTNPVPRRDAHRRPSFAMMFPRYAEI
jgi:hypothetical protein